MEFIADLHVHSKYSRATAKNLDLEHLYQSARIKGVNVVGTGDFTFPAWVDEINDKLEPAEPGLFALKPEIAKKMDAEIPSSCQGDQGKVRFILQTEISNIYKKDGKVRKNHNLIFFPDLDSVKRFNLRLGQIGNITSDGRPILGLDAENLLEIMLETNEQGFFVPAHIWTPWFSMFGSKSGFDSMSQCFGSLVSHIFAVETGLSSDPPMNHRVAELDNVRLISNSDAHSPGFLGRNATVFQTDMDYFSLRKALETNDLEHFQGTYDMYPHQGKYHYDGHRKCGVCLNPEQTIDYDGICPECGRPLTLGVLYRVQELASRPEGFVPENRHGYQHIVPLKDILSELCKVGPNTKKVTACYEKAISVLGPELSILVKTPVETIHAANIPLLGKAIEKIRDRGIHIDPGYDGEYGKVRIFSPEERQKLEEGTGRLFSLSGAGTGSRAASQDRESFSEKKKRSRRSEKTVFSARKQISRNQEPQAPENQDTDLISSLNEDQKKAVLSQARAMMIQAGPGTGKTRTLTAKIAWLVSEKKVPPEHILAVTFTSRAAEELSLRIQSFLPEKGGCVTACTFHCLCLNILRTHAGFQGRPMDNALKEKMLKNALTQAKEKTTSRNLGLFAGYISQCKQQGQRPEIPEEHGNFPASAGEYERYVQEIPNLMAACKIYDDLCRRENLIDFEGIILECILYLKASDKILALLQQQYTHIFVDEYQDVNLAQYQLIQMLAEQANILVIGDKDQSIYGFRGSDFRYFTRFETEYPECEKIVLQQNYRSTQTILDASWQMISRASVNKASQHQESEQEPESGAEHHTRIYSNTSQGQRLLIQSYASDTAEITGIGKMIENLVGGLSFFSFDASKVGHRADHEYSFGDMAVLCRTRSQCRAFAEIFARHGIPFQSADHEKDLSQEGIDRILACFTVFTDQRSDGPNRGILPEILADDVASNPGIHEKICRLASESSRHSSLGLLDEFARMLALPSGTTGSPWFCSVYDRLKALADIFPSPLEFMDNLALAQDQDALSRKAEKVSLMTMHTAKGLEFPVVFVAGCENGLIPFSRGNKENQETDMDEEKRLFYVAMTRAKEFLCLTHAAKRRIYGKVHDQEKSCFLDAIEKELARHEVSQSPLKKTARNSGHVQMELF